MKTLSIKHLLLLTVFFSVISLDAQIKSGEPWPDTDGKHINAH